MMALFIWTTRRRQGRLRSILQKWILLCLCLLSTTRTTATTIATNDDDDNSSAAACPADNNNDNNNNNNNAPIFFPDTCRLVMAPSTIPHGGWGVFVRGGGGRHYGIRQGQALLAGDVVIHMHDLDQSATVLAAMDDSTTTTTAAAAAAASLRRLLVDYAWDASATGGFYEGPTRVVAVSPGIGMLANGLLAVSNNNNNNNIVIPFVPTVDEGGQTRLASPAAGAFTHYHNWTFFVQPKAGIAPGAEVFVHYGPQWFTERQEQFAYNFTTTVAPNVTTRSDEELRQYYCLDNVQPLTRSVAQPTAGRGLQAVRLLPEGHVILPVPVLPLWQAPQLLRVLGRRNDNDATTVVQVHWQLLRNYMYAHPQSSLWLFPYGPFINLLNHHGGDTQQANVRLQWSSRYNHNSINPSTRPWHEASLSELLDAMAGHNGTQPRRPPQLLMELVTLRDITPGEELFLDYGNAWQAAWEAHVQAWQPPPGAQHYAPAYVHDDAIQALRTQDELRSHPYPDNIFTSCFYAYNVTQHADPTKNKNNNNDDDDKNHHVTTVPWEPLRGIFELHNLRPCIVLRRENSQLTHQRRKQGTRFVVQIRNRPNLPPHARVPTGAVHIVTHVPRHAIRFSDKVYTTDVHLPTAFRHEIHLPDHVFPEAWKDLKNAKTPSSSSSFSTTHKEKETSPNNDSPLGQREDSW